MADTVRYLLEQMIPELEDFEKRGLFSRQEIKQIVKKRTNFEYLLKRRAILKEDYLHAIEYEVQLESLRVLRKNALVRDLKSANQRWRSSLSDRAMTRRILFLYERALRKFKGDIRLWLKYAEACRSRGSSRQFQKVVSKALQLHPTVPGLWMYSAAWELEANLNVEGARALMQRGLRMCSSSQQIWIEYLRMEMKAMQKLKARRLLLGLGPVAGQEAGKGMDVEPSAASLSGQGEGSSESPIEVPEDKLSLLLARKILKNAMAAIPKSLEFRMRFAAVVRGLDFNWKGEVEEEVYEDMRREFGDVAECIDLQARRHVGRGKGKDVLDGYHKAVEVYKSALSSAPSPQLHELFASFLEKQLEKGGAAAGGTETVAVELESLYTKAHAEKCDSEGMAERHAGLLLGQGRVKEAEELLAKLCEETRHRRSGVLWALRLGVVTSVRRVGTGGEKGKGEEERVGVLVGEALERVPMAQAAGVWRLALEHWSRRSDGVQLACTAMTAAMVRGGKGEGAAQIACMALRWSAGIGGITAARTLYDRLLALPGPSLELIQACQEMECRAELEGMLDASARIQKLKGLINGF